MPKFLQSFYLNELIQGVHRVFFLKIPYSICKFCKGHAAIFNFAAGLLSYNTKESSNIEIFLPDIPKNNASS